jgi:amidase
MVFGVPLGISFFGTAFSEPTLIKLASGFEAATQVRANNLPTFARTVPFDHIAGTTLKPPHERNAAAASVNQSASPQPQQATKGTQSPATRRLELRRPHHL